MTPQSAIAAGILLGSCLIFLWWVTQFTAACLYLAYIWFRDCVRRYPEELDREARL
jgi:TM2 domain-containing membrane protein YozV